MKTLLLSKDSSRCSGHDEEQNLHDLCLSGDRVQCVGLNRLHVTNPFDA